MIGSIHRHNDYMVREMANRRTTVFNNSDTDDIGGMDGVADNTDEEHVESMTGDDFAARLAVEGDGGVTAEAFGNVHGMRRHFGLFRDGHTVKPGHFQQLFSKLDQDGDNALSEAEVTTFVDRINDWSGTSLSSDEVFAQVDANGDAVVSRDEVRGFKEILGTMRHHRHGMQGYSGEEAPPIDTAIETGSETTAAEAVTSSGDSVPEQGETVSAATSGEGALPMTAPSEETLSVEL